MKSIGFIDHFIDEWHANHFPEMVRKSKLGSGFQVTMAWDETTPPGRKPLADWCREHGVKAARSQAEVVESCDCLVVLSPDNPECQERLADLALRSGKPVYLDKPFTARRAGAEACFAKAQQHGTPLMSCSSLRFTPALVKALTTDFAAARPTYVATRGPGEFGVYSIHQIEMLVRAFGVGARRVMQCGNAQATVLVVAYDDDRRGVVSLAPGNPFGITLGAPGRDAVTLDPLDGFFDAFMDELLGFFTTGRSPIPPAETVEIVALVETGIHARLTPDRWVDLVR